jgi:predicted ATP-grasp superfamily ATP-dependent carboligase
LARQDSPGRLACVAGRLELVRALGAAGIRSLVVAPADELAGGSRFAAAHLPTGGRPLPEVLLAAPARSGEALPLLYDTDEALLAISRNRDALAARYRLLLPDAEVVEDLVDKARFQALADRLELPVPRAVRVRPARASPGDLGVDFPLVLKAVPYRDDRWDRLGESAKVLEIADEAALERVWPRLAAADLELIAQELVPGSERDVLSYHVYVDRTGEVTGEFTGCKIRTSPLQHGQSSALVTTHDAPLLATGRGIIERLGLRGPAKLDFKRGADGRLWLLEVNPRLTLWAHPGAVAGVNLPALAHADLTGAPRPPAGTARPGVRWVAPALDRSAAREEGVALRAWLGFLLRSETNPVAARDDLGPLLRWAGRTLRR